MEYVLDASVALAWCLPDEEFDDAQTALEALRHGSATAPSIWIYEVVSGLRTAIRRGRIESSAVTEVLAMLKALPIEVVAYPVAESLLDFAERFDLSVYDAAYLDLADVRGLPLATRDERLRSAALAAGVEVLAA